MRWLLVLASCSVVLVAAPTGRADVVFHGTKPCPPGSYDETDHCGPWCEPTTCSSDDDCKPIRDHISGKKVERSCREAGLCVEDEKVEACGGWGRGTVERKVARGSCTSEGDCKAPATCRVTKRCVAAAAPAGSSKPAGSSSKPTTSAEPAKGKPDSAPAEPSTPKSSCACEWVGSDERWPTTWLPLAALALLLTATRRRR